MEAEGIPEAAIDTFRHYYEQLESGETGMLPEDSIEPVDEVAEFDELPEEDGPLDRAVVLKLNGGLGTSMGMTQAKSLIEAKDGLAFLDVVARQVQALRERAGAPVPLVLMNSFYTREDSLAKLAEHPELESPVPADFVQHKEPKLLVDDLTPVEWPDDPAQEWCPPGHGDLYTALLTSGMLDALLDAGYRWAFISNSDNLAAVLEPRVLAWIAREEIPFVMEVTDRTEADRKGGHIAKRPRGRLPAARDRADARGGPRRAAGHLAPPLREHEQPLGRPRGAQGADGRARRRARAAADRQQEDRRPGRQVHARGVPARDGDGRRDRRLRGRPAAARAAQPLLAREVDRGPARPALGRLRADRRRARRARPAARSQAARSSTSTTSTTSACATSSGASRRARRRWSSASGCRSRAT